MPSTQARLWTITDFKLDDDRLSDPSLLLADYIKEKQDSNCLTAAQFQGECCPKTDKHHYQGFVYYKAKTTLSRVKDLFPGAHIERCRGSLQENIAYCSKRPSRLCAHQEFGIQRAMMDTMSLQLIPDRMNIIIHGPPKIGKTQKAIKFCQDRKFDFFEVQGAARQSQGRWLSGYECEPVAIFDEFETEQFSISQLKMITDIYSHSVAAAMGGKHLIWCPIYNIFLSNSDMTGFINQLREWKRPHIEVNLQHILPGTKWAIPVIPHGPPQQLPVQLG